MKFILKIGSKIFRFIILGTKKETAYNYCLFLKMKLSKTSFIFLRSNFFISWVLLISFTHDTKQGNINQLASNIVHQG